MTAGDELDVEFCIVNRVQELLEQKALVPLLIKLVGFMQSLRDSFFSEYEISNHNVLVTKTSQGEYDFSLINQVLPLQYHAEFGAFLSTIYEEDHHEHNERLLVKKVVFLLIALAVEDGVQDFASIKQMLQ